MSSTPEEVVSQITAKGEEIRVLKQAKPATLKQDLEPLVADLLSLKSLYKSLTGEDYGPPPKEEKPKV
jgi:hypothetical protein